MAYFQKLATIITATTQNIHLKVVFLPVPTVKPNFPTLPYKTGLPSPSEVSKGATKAHNRRNTKRYNS